eukprot:13525288-Alexandrium_andersonii.AAC.1
MPHVHSPAALARRLDRAAARGFLPAKPQPINAEDLEFRRRLKTVGKSMAIHRAHCKAAGFDIHNAGTAAALLKPVIGQDAYNTARRAHRARNRALHEGFCSAPCPVGGDPRLYLSD